MLARKSHIIDCKWERRVLNIKNSSGIINDRNNINNKNINDNGNINSNHFS